MPTTPQRICADRHLAGEVHAQPITKSVEENITLAADPLGASIALPFHQVLFPFGFSAQVRSNEPKIIRIAGQSWGAFRHRYRENPIELRFLISHVHHRRLPGYPTFRAQGNLLTLVADVHNYACCDLAAGFGFACLTGSAARNADYVRYHFLEAMVYTLLDAQHLVAIHAACVAKDGRGVLLLGDSGAGKSSLAYACARRGWTYISDDSSSLLRRRTGRVVVGNPQTFRFRPTATELFPELRGPVKVRNGKPTVEIRTELLPGIRTALECTVDYVIFLNRVQQDGVRPRLEDISREESLRRLSQQNAWPIELSIQEERLETIKRLLGAQLLKLTYKEFDPAVAALEQALDRR